MLVYKSETEVYRTHSDSGYGSVSFSEVGNVYTKNRELSVRDLGDDIVSITIHQYFYNNETNKTEDFGCDEYGNLFVSREHALEFANSIIEALRG